MFGTGLPTVVKLVDKETLLKEREEKKRVWGREFFGSCSVVVLASSSFWARFPETFLKSS
jgi:hypothetical protein